MENELRLHRVHGLHPGAAPAVFPVDPGKVVLSWGVGQTYRQARSWARMANARYTLGDVNYRFPMMEVRNVGR